MKSQWRSTLALAGGLLLQGSLTAGDQKPIEAGLNGQGIRQFTFTVKEKY